MDAFAGSGVHLARSTREFIPGSPLNALNITPPFRELHFIDLDGSKVESLRQIVGARSNVFVYHGDCNSILRNQVFARARREDYRRALCLLDPYGLHLDWEVIAEAGQMKSVEIFLNFPMMDMNRNVLWRNPDVVSPEQVERMTRFWGDDSWRQAAYTTRNLFNMEMKADASNEAVIDAFRSRLRDKAGFAFVPEALPMKNSLGFVVDYLVFASPNATGGKIVKEIFDKYQSR